MKRNLLLLLINFFSGLNTVYCQDINGTYAIKNVQTGIFIRIKDANSKNGTPIVAYSPVNWKCVTWDFKKQNGNFYQLVNLFSNKTLQPSAIAKEGTAMEEQPLVLGNTTQQYKFIPVEKNVYLIKLKGTELYLCPSDSEGNINNPIILKPNNNSRLQYWQLKEQHPEI